MKPEKPGASQSRTLIRTTSVEPAQSSQVQTVSADDTALKELPPILYPRLMVAVRNDFPKAELVQRCIDFCLQDKRNWMQAVSDSIDSNVSDIPHEELLSSIERSGIDPIQALMSLLRSEKKFTNKTVAATLILNSQGGFDAFVNNYILPVLEKRPSIENQENNKAFCMKFLNSLSGEQISNLFKSIDYQKMTNIGEFSTSVSELKKCSVVLEALLDATQEDETSYTTALPKKRIQVIALSALKTLKAAKKDLPASPLRKLYRHALNEDISDGACELLKHIKMADFENYFMDLPPDSTILDYEERHDALYAINDYAFLHGEKAAGKLKEFILKSKDPYLVTYTSYMLANICKNAGQEALLSAIGEQAKKDEPSIPFAFVCAMATRHSGFKDILKALFSRQYPEHHDLQSLFSNAENMEICEIGMNDDGRVTFDPISNQRVPSFVDILTSMGLGTFVSWVNEDKQGYTRDNLLNLLDIAVRTRDKWMISSSVSAGLISADNEIRQFLQAVAGKSLIQPQEEVTG